MRFAIASTARCGILAALLGTALLGATTVHAQIKERTLRFSYVQPKDSHMGFGVQKFADIVAQKSGKKITVRGFPDGTLGGDIQTLSALQGGTLDMTTMPPSLLVGRAKVFGAFSMHFLFNDFAEADAILDGPIGQRFIGKVPQDLVGLGYWDHGFRNISNGRRAVSKLEDLKGLKLRVVQEPLFIDSFNALGANAVGMSFTELYNAMESRAVDGQDNPIAAFEANKFYEVQKHLSATRHVYQPLIVLISRKTWDQLSVEERKLLQDAARETAVEQRKASRAMETKSIAAVQKGGTVYTEISTQERARMRDAIKPVNDKYLQEISAIDSLPGDMVKAIESHRAKP
jgi:tripartite ATP-independent transporter DctP family solute receptor